MRTMLRGALAALAGCSFTPSGGSLLDADVLDTRLADAGEPPDAALVDALPTIDAAPCNLARSHEGDLADRVGGNGGETQPPLDCGANRLPVGLRVDVSNQDTIYGGASLYGVSLVCAEVSVGPTSVVNSQEVTFRGTGCCGWAPATTSSVTMCPAGAIMSGLAAHIGNASQLFRDVSIDCQPIAPDASLQGARSTLPVPGSGDSLNNLDSSVCGAGTVMTGLTVRGGAGVDALTPRCAPLRCAL